MTFSTKTTRSAVLFQNGSIGDFLMSIFLAEMLQKSGHVDHITIVVPRNLNFLRGLIEEYPYISAIEISRRGGWGQILKMMRHPNLVIIQPTLGKIPFRVKLVGWLISRSYGSQFLGFQDKGLFCKILYSKALIYNTDHLYSDNIQNIVRALGRPILVNCPELKITPSIEYIKASGLYRRPYMVFHPGASALKRSFTVQGAREVIQFLVQNNPEMHVVLSGGDGHRRFIEEIKNGLGQKQRIITAIGRSAQELATLIQSAEFYLGIDTGITHLACFLRARVIVAAHSGTAMNWLPFYCPTATVLYRLEGEEGVHQDREYLDACRRGRVKPFGMVPTNAVCAVLDEYLDRRAQQCIGSECRIVDV